MLDSSVVLGVGTNHQLINDNTDHGSLVVHFFTHPPTPLPANCSLSAHLHPFLVYSPPHLAQLLRIV